MYTNANLARETIKLIFGSSEAAAQAYYLTLEEARLLMSQLDLAVNIAEVR